MDVKVIYDPRHKIKGEIFTDIQLEDLVEFFHDDYKIDLVTVHENIITLRCANYSLKLEIIKDIII